jgi:GNAT superfamily N-acetyltransferase
MLNHFDPAFAAFRCVTDFYRRIYWQAPTAITRYTDHYSLSYSGVAWLNSINHLWLNMPCSTSNLATALADAERFFQPYNADYNVVFSEPCAPELIELLIGFGYTERLRSPMLILDGLPHLEMISDVVQVVRVTESIKHDLLRVLYEAFYLGPDLSRCMMRDDQIADPATRHYIGYVNGEPACCVSVLLGTDGIAGVWNVGTVRHLRRRGLASTVLGQALREAVADGCPVSVLLASEMGRPLYESMGYRWVGETTYYSLAEMQYLC